MERRKYCRSSSSAFSILSLANSVLFTYDIAPSDADISALFTYFMSYGMFMVTQWQVC